MTTTCSSCSFPIKFAPSKRVQVCKNCQSIERTGKSLKEIAHEKHRESMEKSRLKSKAKSDLKPKTVYVIKNRSTKGAKQEREISKTKTEIKLAALDGGFCECEGCGNFFDTIDASHIVPVSQSSVLASDPANITLLCRECHQRFENGTVLEMIELKCLVPDLKYMLRHDKARFWNIFDRILEEYLVRPTPKLSAVLDKLERLDQ